MYHYVSFYSFCSEVKLMMNSQKNAVENKGPHVENYSRTFFFLEYSHMIFKLKLVIISQVITCFKVK